ncbi:MAG: sigma-70 family RNA polymerase sigma factor [Lachnospiraceae bacterium]|nr:sigma-70 family RNA polymerase sigma factor [Lachnospiraceae bacterium]
MKHLVMKAQQKDGEAFVKLMEMNKQSMYKVAKSYLRYEEDVADAMQETILICYEKLGDLKEPKYFKTWMIRILINKCKDILKKNQELCLMEEFPEVEDQHVPEKNLEFEELLQALDEKYRTILILYYVEGFNTREIGALLEISEHTVKTRLVRARQNFAREYQKEMAYVGR